MVVDGECLCGYLRWTAVVDEVSTETCNCTDCQVLSGSAFRVNVPVVNGEFRFLTGTPSTYVKTAASGNRRELAFCPTCGTSVFSRPEGGRDGYFGLRVGSLRQKSQLVPQMQTWRRSALEWIDSIDSIPKYDGNDPV